MKRIVNDTQHASEVIDGIRSMFKNEGQVKTLQDINELIREALTPVRAEVENQRVSICTELSIELPQVPANQVQLRQVMVNLIMNAVDAMSAVTNRARALRIKTEGHKLDGVLISVEDSGMGIEPQNLDRIFDAFFTTKSHGMGMGLAICRSIIKPTTVASGRNQQSIKVRSFGFHCQLDDPSDVRFWHLTDIQPSPGNVRFWV